MSAFRNHPIRVGIVDSYVLMRTGLRLIIDSHPEMEVVGEAGNSNEALELITRFHPDIILLTFDSEGIIGLEIIQRLLLDSINLRIILLARVDEASVILSAVKAGVQGIVFKNQTEEVLIKAIEKVHAGEIWIERTVINSLLSSYLRTEQLIAQDLESGRIAQLSDREKNIIQLLRRGLRNKQIAEQLSLSETTIRHNLTAIYNKLNVSDRLELVVYAHHHGLD